MYNAIYQSNSDVWVAYSAYISNYFAYGGSKSITHHLDFKGNRRSNLHFMGPTRTWYVKLIRQIPLAYHQFRNGTWLDTMYDDALQDFLYDLAGDDRMIYYPEITYLYNRFYGQNDDSSLDKRKHRDISQL